MTPPTEGGETNLRANDYSRELRQLALVDRVIGLEAEVARLSCLPRPVSGQAELVEIDRLHNELRAVYGSRAFRVGTLILRPLRAFRRLLRVRL